MLLKVTHLGTRDDHRLYYVHTPHGTHGILDLSGQDREITLLLVGAYYRREYPASAELDDTEPPRIRDLEGGYQTIQTFLAAWEHATPEQREDLLDPDLKPLYTYRKHGAVQRNKRKLELVEDRPRHVPATQAGDWYRAKVRDLRAALKGVSQARNVRIGHITVRRSVLYGLLDTKSALTVDPIVELRYDGATLGGSLLIRSTDGRAKVTVKHGAGDRHEGRYGFTRRIAFTAA